MHKFIENCVQYMYRMFGFAEKLNIQSGVNSTGNYVHYTYGMYGFVDKLNIQNSVNSTGNRVHFL